WSFPFRSSPRSLRKRRLSRNRVAAGTEPAHSHPLAHCHERPVGREGGSFRSPGSACARPTNRDKLTSHATAASSPWPPAPAVDLPAGRIHAPRSRVEQPGSVLPRRAPPRSAPFPIGGRGCPAGGLVSGGDR